MVDDGLRIAQCWFGVANEGKSKFRSENNGGFGDASWPSGLVAGWRR